MDCLDCKYHQQQDDVHYCIKYKVSGATIQEIYSDAEECEVWETPDDLWVYSEH
jgi:hypothetical protein